MSPLHLGLIANEGKPGAAELVQALSAALRERGIAFTLEARTAHLAGVVSTATEAELARDCGLLVVLGGDGTILQVLHRLGDVLPPILGINLGTLGFLTCVSSNAWPDAVTAIATGSYVLSKRTLLDVEVRRGEVTVERRTALNDAVISRGELSRLIRLNVFVDRATLSEYNADGLIVATPTGSTAYSLSAGGPVLTPDSGAFVITPICPHVLTMRPVMVSDSSLLEIVPTQGQTDIFLTLDGQDSLRISSDDRICISKAPRTLSLALLPGMPFFEVLRQKLKWSGTAI
ncbi:MAG TPA: NAD(+)/NADH kinase [Chthoniobacteraceae bacterium]|jgi:NAD+ kinase|nr:NAD(+)/NADH kinase [Chthoniobacteraceae bacterium]